MEQAALPRDSFMEGIKTLTGEIVKRVKDFREAQQQVELPEMELDCPSCHAHGLKTRWTPFPAVPASSASARSSPAAT